MENQSQISVRTLDGANCPVQTVDWILHRISLVLQLQCELMSK